MIGEIVDSFENTIFGFTVYILMIEKKFYVPMSQFGIEFISEVDYLEKSNENKVNPELTNRIKRLHIKENKFQKIIDRIKSFVEPKFSEINEDEKTKIQNLNFVFESSDHLRFENGILTSGPHGGARRAVKVENNIEGGEGYSVSMYNLDGNHPIWQNNIQMTHKPMKIIKSDLDKVSLRGFGVDNFGGQYSDYGLTICYENDIVIGCTLHMFDRNIEIEYLK